MPTPKASDQKNPLIPKNLLFALAVGLAARVLYLAFSKDNPFYEPLLLDPKYYHDWALKILQGDFVGDGVFYGLPLYPFFLALCYKVFYTSIFAVKIVQIFLGLVSLFFIYKIGEKIGSPNVGLAAVFLAAVYGPLFFHEQILIPEVLSVPLYAASFYWACLFLDQPTVARGVILGILSGLAALTKAGIILFALVFIVFLCMRKGSDPKGQRGLTPPILIYLVTFFLTLLPVTAHNFIYGQDKVFLTSHAGFNFYIGNNPKAEGVFAAPEGTGTNVEAQIEDSRAIAEREMGHALKPSEVSHYWSDKAWAYIKAHPLNFFQLSLRKLVLFFDAREISDVDDYAFAKNFNPVLRFPWLDFSIMGPLFLLGIVIFFENKRYRWLVYVWVVTYLAGMVTFFVNARYRLPILSVAFPLAAFAIVQIIRRLKEQNWRQLFFYALILSLAIWVTQARWVGTNFLRDYVNSGDAYQEKKEYEKAMDFYKGALKIDPDAAKANLGMGVLLTRLGQHEEAEEYYMRCLAAEPKNSQALNNLGLWYERKGDLEKAQRYFSQAIDAKPNSSQAHNNLGMIYGKTGDNEKAKKEFQISLKLNPSSPRANTNLGLIYYRTGKTEEARRLWEKALAIDPTFEEAKRGLELLKRGR